MRRKNSEQAEHERGGKGEEEGNDTGAQVVAVADHAQGGIVALAAEDDVDVAPLGAHLQRRRGKGAQPRLALRGSSPSEPGARRLDEIPHRPEVDRAAHDLLRGVEKIGKDPSRARPGGRSPPWG